MKIHFVSTYNESPGTKWADLAKSDVEVSGKSKIVDGVMKSGLLPDGVTAEQITVVVPEFSEVIQNLNRTFNGCRLIDDDVLLIQNRWGDHEASLFER